jgi:ATP diphosphatase
MAKVFPGCRDRRGFDHPARHIAKPSLPATRKTCPPGRWPSPPFRGRIGAIPRWKDPMQHDRQDDDSFIDSLIRDPDGGMPRLLAIMARLRDPRRGCPWDLEQDFASIAPYTLEEAHEVADAIQRQAWAELRGELGDLLFQTVFHARMAEEAGLFAFPDVVAAIADKMVARHPHVFGSESRDKTAEEQTRDWEALKARERGRARVLDGVALALPALTRAVKLQNRAARVGFDWPSAVQVLDKLTEEAREVVEARDSLDPEAVAEELGDLLFVVATLARHLQVDPEAALRAANAKFTRRFARIEDWLAAEGRSPAASDLAEMDALWNRAKAEDKAKGAARGSTAGAGGTAGSAPDTAGGAPDRAADTAGGAPGTPTAPGGG